MEKFDEEFEEIQFKSLDQNQQGKIDYYEFLKHETGKLLIKRDKVSFSLMRKWAYMTLSNSGNVANQEIVLILSIMESMIYQMKPNNWPVPRPSVHF